ncbi:hypothetical protein [Ruminococcus sp.]|uniref:hypothetical protein n=1 Tax=Ruminococcus sp. TaxID=41978 RepID=UPI0039966984
MEGDPTFDTILWVLLILLLLLHLLFAAGMAAVSTLGNQMGAMAEKHPEMAYYQKQKTPLLYGRVSELIFLHGRGGGTGHALCRFSRLDSVSDCGGRGALARSAENCGRYLCASRLEAGCLHCSVGLCGLFLQFCSQMQPAGESVGESRSRLP